MKKFHLVLGAVALVLTAQGAFAQDIHLNEIFVSHSGTDDREFIELIGTPYLALDHHMVLVVEGDSVSAGYLDRAWDLTGYAVPADGYFVLGDSAVPDLDFDLGASGSLENGTETVYLVDAGDAAGVSAILSLLGTDLDPDGDGYTDLPALSTIKDLIGIVDSGFPGGSDRVFDDADHRGPDGAFLPAGIFRDVDFPNDWSPGFLDFDVQANLLFPRTPGARNVYGKPTTLRITEVMYAGAGGAFVEFTNVGDEIVEMKDWSFDDDHAVPGTVDLTSYGDVAPGESVVLAADPEAVFITDWNLSGVKVIGAMGPALDPNDILHLYDPADGLVDTLSYGPDAFPTSVRPLALSAWPCEAFVGGNEIFGWVLSRAGDFQASAVSLNGDVGSPGFYQQGLVLQQDLGFGGPGSARLSMYGEPLSLGNWAAFQINNLPPLATGLLMVSPYKNAVPFKGGTLVPFPFALEQLFFADARGDVYLPGIPGGGGPGLFYFQFIYVDGAQAQGMGFTNAVEIEVLQ